VLGKLKLSIFTGEIAWQNSFDQVSIHLYNEGQECKKVLLGEGTNESERANGEGKGGRIWVIYFMCAYEDRTLKSTKIILSRR
jgi:hypothetical protein